MGPSEYHGAVELPYYEGGGKGGAKVHVAIEAGGVNSGLLHVFAERVPFYHPLSVAVLIDHDRFEDHPKLVGPGTPDVALVFEFATNTVTTFEAREIGPGYPRWVQVATPMNAGGVLGTCVPGERYGFLCDLEFAFPVTDAFIAAVEGEAPGIGIAVVGIGMQTAGSMPEELAELGEAPEFFCDHAYCTDLTCRSAVCIDDDVCCADWDSICTARAENTHVCNAPTCASASSLLCYNRSCYDSRCAADSYCCNTAWDSICEADATVFDPTCLLTSNCAGHTGPCEDLACRNTVCDGDPWCCTSWDSICEERALHSPMCHAELAVLPDWTFDRTLYQTLLFEVPPGTEFRIATYNARRFGVEALDSPFHTVELDDVAEFLLPYDIVGLQEMWVTEDVEYLVGRLNALDPTRPPMVAVGPPSHSNRFLASATEWVMESHGGTWLLSRYPVIDFAYVKFADCRGEDCLKAKGAVHARVNLNPATPESIDCSDEPCPAPSTTEEFVDVFVTHLQAPAPEACVEGAGLSVLMVDGMLSIASPLTGGFIDVARPLLGSGLELQLLVSQGLHCSRDQSEVVMGQLDQFGAFIEARAHPRRQAIILGDFNIDGQYLNNNGSGGTSGYAEMLARIGVIPAARDRTIPHTDDSLPFIGAAYDWGLQHGDLAREVHTAWGVSAGLGTHIAEDWSVPATLPVGSAPDPTNQLFGDRNADGMPDGVERYDYILVRPGARFEDEGPDYALARSDAGPTFAVRWPLVDDPMVISPPWMPSKQRLTDHMLAEAHLRLLPLRQPPRYHPDVAHRVTVEVTSVDAQNIQDCVFGLCNPLDLYTRMDIRHVFAGGAESHAMMSPLRTITCEGWTMHTPPSECGAQWTLSATQLYSVDQGFRSAIRLFDEDVTSADDELFTVEGNRHPEIHFDWQEGWLRVRAYGNPLYQPVGWTTDIPYTERRQWCTRHRGFITGGNQAALCLAVTIDEVAP